MAYERDKVKWSHDETVIALGLYCQLPFKNVNKATPEVVAVSRLMKRKPASLSMKIGNIGRLDPMLAVRGITGLKHGAKMEQLVWDEYANRPDELAAKYHELLAALKGGSGLEEDQLIKTPPGLEGARLMHYRVNQSFFRKTVMAAYANTCCITGMNDPRLLIASHIKPWSKCDTGEERTNVENGLCLNALHDKAFDKGLITLDDDMRIVNSRSLRDAMTVNLYEEYFSRYEGIQINMPSRCRPSVPFLEYHRNHIFQGV